MTEEIDKVFYTLIKLFEEHNIPYWLSLGSLLGAVREGQRIPWDHDYDIGYPIEYAMDVFNLLYNIPRDVFVTAGLFNFQIRGQKNEPYVCVDPFAVIDNQVYCVAGWNKFKIFAITGIERKYRLLKSFYKLLIKLSMTKPFKYMCLGDSENYKDLFLTKMGEIDCTIPLGYHAILTDLYGNYMIPKKDIKTCYRPGRDIPWQGGIQ